jgi:hypothetical protein
VSNCYKFWVFYGKGILEFRASLVWTDCGSELLNSTSLGFLGKEIVRVYGFIGVYRL